LSRLGILGVLLLGLLATVPVEAAPKRAEAESNRLLNRAVQELARYELDAGLATLSEVLELTPTDGFAHSRLAEVLAVGLGRGAETLAAYRAVAAAQPDDPIRGVWVARIEMARHVEDRWVVRYGEWVQPLFNILEPLSTDDDREVRYAAWIALRDLLLMLEDQDEAARAGAEAIALFPHRLQARVSAMIAARHAGDAKALQALCQQVIRDTPGAVEACSMLFSGSTWTDQGTLEAARERVLVDVARLGRSVLKDAVLAHEVAKFYGRGGLPNDLQATYIAQVLAKHPDFKLSIGSRWWRGRPPPLKTSLRRVRAAADDVLARMQKTPRDAPWILEEQATRATTAGDHEEALRLVQAAAEALTELPYSPSASLPPTTLRSWSEARSRDYGRLLAMEAAALRALGRDDEAWPLAQRAAWLHEDGGTWLALADSAAIRGHATFAAEADLEALARLDGSELVRLPIEYRERATARFVAANPALADTTQGWLALLSAAAARGAARREGLAETEGAPKETHPLLGQPAPEWSVKTLSGEEFSTSSVAGRVVVVDFWATWCGPCKRAMPGLQQAHEALGDDAVFLMLSVDQELDVVQKFMAGSVYTFDVAHVGEGGKDGWAVEGIPSTFVLDQKGIVRHHHQGFHRDGAKRIQEQVGALLGN
jgi:thiol-disulfide isomerase/thioredoxin